YASRPAVMIRINAESFTVFVKCPMLSRDEAIDITPYLLTSPYVGFNPTVFVKLAGSLIEPPVSVPVANAERLAATATPEPEEEPPGTYSLFQGFRVSPKSEFSPDEPCAHASWFNLPSEIAPSSSSLSTAVEE